MITLEDLAGLKLVVKENFASDEEVVSMIEGATVQGSQGWGVNRPTACLLNLAQALEAALVVAATATEARNALKGEQMARGRVQKQLDGANKNLGELAAENSEQDDEIAEFTETVADLRAELAVVREVDGE